MTETIVVTPEGGDRLRVRIGNHELVADQPVSAGGEDIGPTPTDLFVAGYAACVAHYGSRYLRRHDLPTDGLSVRCTYLFADEPPPRVQAIQMEVGFPDGLSERDDVAIRRVMERCTVSNTLQDPPRVDTAYRRSPAVEPAGREEPGKEAGGMFSNIVLTVDGSEESKKAAVLGADVACAGHAEIVVLHVREFGATAGLSYPYEQPVEAPDLVDEAVRGLKDLGISARGEVRDCLHGSVAEQIVRLADEVDADLIVMGSRGLSDWAGAVMGSVTHAVLHNTHRPVLVAR